MLLCGASKICMRCITVLQATLAKKMREESASLLRSATEVQRSSLNELNDVKSKLDEKISALKANIEQHKLNIDSMRNRFDDEDLVSSHHSHSFIIYDN